MIKWLFLVFLMQFACTESKEQVRGYVIQEMIRAMDSLRYMDTVGTIYQKGTSVFIKERPGIYDFQRFSDKN